MYGRYSCLTIHSNKNDLPNLKLFTIMFNAEYSAKAEEYMKQVHQLTRLFVLDASLHD